MVLKACTGEKSCLQSLSLSLTAIRLQVLPQQCDYEIHCMEKSEIEDRVNMSLNFNLNSKRLCENTANGIGTRSVFLAHDLLTPTSCGRLYAESPSRECT